MVKVIAIVVYTLPSVPHIFPQVTKSASSSEHSNETPSPRLYLCYLLHSPFQSLLTGSFSSLWLCCHLLFLWMLPSLDTKTIHSPGFFSISLAFPFQFPLGVSLPVKFGFLLSSTLLSHSPLSRHYIFSIGFSYHSFADGFYILSKVFFHDLFFVINLQSSIYPHVPPVCLSITEAKR